MDNSQGDYNSYDLQKEQQLTDEEYKENYLCPLRNAVLTKLFKDNGSITVYEKLYSLVYTCTVTKRSEQLHADIMLCVESELIAFGQQCKEDFELQKLYKMMEGYLRAIPDIAMIFSYLEQVLNANTSRSNFHLEFLILLKACVIHPCIDFILKILNNHQVVNLDQNILYFFVYNLLKFDPEYLYGTNLANDVLDEEVISDLLKQHQKFISFKRRNDNIFLHVVKRRRMV